MKKFKRKRVILCPTCKTGQDSYRLDNLSEACPYISCYNGMRCAYYVPIEKEPRLFDKLKNRIFKNR